MKPIEWLEMDDDTIPHPIATHRRQELIAKATEIILVAEEKETMCDRLQAYFEDFEPGMNFMPPNMFK